ncbi:MAG: IS200/IS605 family transposase [Sutterella sp.]|nr:IS200/IS605 family transposase [Sutterella sp.]
MTDLRSGAHCVYNINIHLVLVVAYRRKAITGAILSTIQEVLHRIPVRLEIRILDFSGEADHIHLLVSIPPRYAISDLVNRIKTATSRAIRQKHAKVIEPFLWGNRFWSNSYCAVGDGRSIESVKRYIQG